MSETDLNTLLLWDAVATTIASPGASHCWHRLRDCCAQVNNAATKTALINDLLARTPDDGTPGFLRATWLASMTRDYAHLVRAGQIVQNIAPFDPDRIVAFLTVAWSQILSQANDIGAFSQAVRAAFIPELLHKLGQHLIQHSSVRPPVRTIERIQKVAIVTPYLGAYPHAPTAIALQQARILIEQGVQVELFSCLELTVPGMTHFLGAGESVTTPAFDVAQWTPHCLPGIPIHHSDERFSVMTRWAGMLTPIAAFDPDLVMSVGFYSPLLAPLSETRPVLGLNVHSVAPLDPVDVWLCASPADAGKEHTPWGSHFNSIGWHHPYRVQRRLPATTLSRQAIGLLDTALVLISVGYRLEIEIDGAWAASMIELLRARPNIAWLLVGGTMPSALAQAPTGQVVVLAQLCHFFDDLPLSSAANPHECWTFSEK